MTPKSIEFRASVRRMSAALILASAIGVGTVMPAFSHGIADQQQTVSTPPCFNLFSVFSGNALQSFTPTADAVVGVDGQFEVSSDMSITGSVLPGECPTLGAVLASDTVAVSSGSQIVHFDFDVPTSVTPGQKYTIRIDSTFPSNVNVCGSTTAPPGPYADGSVFTGSCGELAGSDGYFVTYGPATTTSTTTTSTTTTTTSTTTSTTTTTTSTSSTTSTTLPESACDAAPRVGCLSGASASLMVKDNVDNAKDLLKWKLKKGDAFDQALLGNPATTRAYTLCVYDETSTVPLIVAAVTIEPSSSWTSKDPSGFTYTDKTGAEDGVTKAGFKAGAAGKTAVSLRARGANLPLPAPVSTTEFLDQDTDVIVQMINDETASCWSTTFAVAMKNKVDLYKAKAP